MNWAQLASAINPEPAVQVFFRDSAIFVDVLSRRTASSHVYVRYHRVLTSKAGVADDQSLGELIFEGLYESSIHLMPDQDLSQLESASPTDLSEAAGFGDSVAEFANGARMVSVEWSEGRTWIAGSKNECTKNQFAFAFLKSIQLSNPSAQELGAAVKSQLLISS